MKCSVAICTYNGASYIREQVLSIINQSTMVDEIVLCDDCSTDETIEIVKSIDIPSNITLRIIENEINIGYVKNFEQAVSLCSGDIIFLSDQDDIWHSNKVKTITKYFSDNPAKRVVFTNANLIDEKNELIGDKTLFDCVGLDKTGQKYFDKGYALELFCQENRVTGATMAIKKNLYWDAVLCNNEVIHDELIALMALNENVLGYISDCVMDYRIHHGQTLGLSGLITEPLSSNALQPASYAVRYYELPWSERNKKRIVFCRWRANLKCKVIGPIIASYHMMTYRDVYNSDWLTFFYYDIKNSLQHSVSRIRKKISRTK